MRGNTPLSLFLSLLSILAACGLVHREKPNEAPRLRSLTATPTEVARGGRVKLTVLASDEDDDPLFYRWKALGTGAFSDTTCVGRSRLRCDDITWFAPPSIVGSSQRFLISVIIRDRQCEIVLAEEERMRCEENVGEAEESVSIEVVQTPPTVQLVADTSVTLSNESVSIVARGEDKENDALVYTWEQTAGKSVDFDSEGVAGGRRLTFTPPAAGDYGFRVTVDDAADNATADVLVHIAAPETAAAAEKDDPP